MAIDKGGEKEKCLHCIGCPYLSEAAAILGTAGGRKSRRTLSTEDSQRMNKSKKLNKVLADLSRDITALRASKATGDSQQPTKEIFND